MSDPVFSASRFGEPATTKRDAVLLAAAEVFLQVGYGAASMDAIARTAGVSKATVYAYFPSKDALFAAIIDYGCRNRFGGQFDPAASSGDIATDLRDIGRRFYDMVLAPEGLAMYRVVVAEAVRFPELGRAFYDAGPRQTLDNLERMLQSAADRGQLDIKEPRSAAEQFMGLIRGDLFLRRLLGMADESEIAGLDEAVQRAVQTFMTAYAPAPRLNA